MVIDTFLLIFIDTISNLVRFEMQIEHIMMEMFVKTEFTTRLKVDLLLKTFLLKSLFLDDISLSIMFCLFNKIIL